MNGLLYMNQKRKSASSPWVLDDSRVPWTSAHRDNCERQLVGCKLGQAVERLYSGAEVNPSERQPALHMALRASDLNDWNDDWNNDQCGPELQEQRERFLALAEHFYRGDSHLKSLIHVGIGGSDLGPRLLSDALGPENAAVQVHFLSTLDYRKLKRLLVTLDPATTGVIVASKSFTTEETLLQAREIFAWLGDHAAKQAWAATARADRALAFGFSADSILEFPHWTGGRFSMWSSVGTAAAATMGRVRFEQLLAGAAAADREFFEASMQSVPDQLAHRLALLIHGLRRELALPTLGVVAYEPRLALLGDYLQQLVMESLGKRVDLSGQALAAPTAPLIFSGRGTDAQHAMFQAFHQGCDNHPLLLVGCLKDDQVDPLWQQTQLAHLLGQAEAFSAGVKGRRSCEDLPGQRPVSLLMAETLTPHHLGYLLASFEHAVFTVSVMWGINPFDQWGVEEGKRLARALKGKLASTSFDLEDLSQVANLLKDSE